MTVIGTGDAQTMMPAERGRRAVAREGNPAVRFDYVEIGPHDRTNGVDELPALVVDGHVVAQGSVPKMHEVAEALEQALAAASKDDLRTAAAADAVPRCGGCGRNCSLDDPKCRVGKARARELDISE